MLSDEQNAIYQWWRSAKENAERYGRKAWISECQRLFVQGGLRLIGKYLYNYGTYVFDRDWDILIVLDACRSDLFNDLPTEYEFIPETIPTTCSVGTHTSEWMSKNFTERYHDEMKKTAYVTGNPQSDHYTTSEQWLVFDEPWRCHRDNLGTIPPGAVTDAAVSVIREHQPQRSIIHYMQPHQPFRAFSDIEQDTGWITNDVWEALRFGEYEAERVWDAYVDNLQWVLDDIERLLQAVDAKQVVITSDHGNTFGGCGLYGHPPYVPLDTLKRVPWIKTTAADNGTYRPNFNSDSVLDASVDERLQDLGYA